MDRSHFDRMTTVLSRGVGNRRAALGTVAAAALGGAVLAPVDGPAKKKKLAFECPGPNDTVEPGSGVSRIGQVFAATRSGTLRQIRVGIHKLSGTTGDCVVQLLKTSGSPAVPSNSPLAVLAAATIPDASVPVGDSTLVANFAGTKLVQGTSYGVVVSRPGSNSLLVQIHGSNVCPGVATFADGAGAFTNSPGFDVIVSVLVS